MIRNMIRRNILRAGLGLAVSALTAGIVAPAFAQEQATTLRWAMWDLDTNPYFRLLAEAFQKKHPNVKIDFLDLGSTDYNQMIATQMAGGGADVDVITIRDIPNYANLIRTGSLLDLTSWFDEQKIDPASYGGLMKHMTVDGKIYAIPFRGDFWVVYYNKRLFDAKGIAYPTNDMTYAQHDELARSMTSGIGANKIYGTHLHTWRSPVQYPAILDGKHTLAGPEYGFLKPWYERGLKLQDDRVVASYAALKSSSTHYSSPFFNEKLAMLPIGTYFIGIQLAKLKSGESRATEWGIAALPHPEGVPVGTNTASISALGVNAKSAHKDIALDFVKFASGPEGAKIVASTGTIPAIRDETVMDTIASLPGFPTDPGSREALKANMVRLELPVTLNAARIDVLLTRIHDAIMTNTISIDEGIKRMNEEIGALK